MRFILLAIAFLGCITPAHAQGAKKPNIIYILADDLGYGEVGCYGQKKIKTPQLDKLAANGLRFTQHYAGNAVCAPSRCVLMTGKHSGHARIRNNIEMKPDGQQPIAENTVTIARLLKALGYVTGMIGKWGLGMHDSSGDPQKQGFDHFFGYYCQRHAHNHYPTFLWRNAQKVPLEGNPSPLTPLPQGEGKGVRAGKQHSHDLFEKEALDFIRKNKDKPFFLYLPFTIPHVALQVPDDSLAEYKGLWDDPPYKGGKGYQPHDHPRAAYAAMVTRMDRTIGRIVQLLRDLGLEEDTIVIFSSDNGPTHDGVGGSDSLFFRSAGLLRGFKGSLFEGGVRAPMIAYWPRRIRPGRTSDHISGFQDVMPTLCDIAGAKTPKDIDGISMLPTLLDNGEQKKHEFLYWEFPGYGGQQAVRLGDWKAIRQNMHKGNMKLQLFDLANDVGETKDLAADHPAIVARIERIMREQHVPSKLFPFKAID
ncbi:MAG: arylsulfatase [Planctomycetes bacterium]|nr:arylsulfatase [Planctomycetota bacterium]